MSYQKKYFLDLLLGKVIILFLFYFSDLSDLGDTSVSGNCWLFYNNIFTMKNLFFQTQYKTKCTCKNTIFYFKITKVFLVSE